MITLYEQPLLLLIPPALCPGVMFAKIKGTYLSENYLVMNNNNIIRFGGVDRSVEIDKPTAFVLSGRTLQNCLKEAHDTLQHTSPSALFFIQNYEIGHISAEKLHIISFSFSTGKNAPHRCGVKIW